MASKSLETFKTWLNARDDFLDDQKTELFDQAVTMMHGAYYESNSLQEVKLRKHVNAHRSSNISNSDAVAVADTMLALLERIRDGSPDLASSMGAAIDDVAGI